jgi:hypothetical protein
MALNGPQISLSHDTEKCLVGLSCCHTLTLGLKVFENFRQHLYPKSFHSTLEQPTETHSPEQVGLTEGVDIFADLTLSSL